MMQDSRQSLLFHAQIPHKIPPATTVGSEPKISARPCHPGPPTVWHPPPLAVGFILPYKNHAIFILWHFWKNTLSGVAQKPIGGLKSHPKTPRSMQETTELARPRDNAILYSILLGVSSSGLITFVVSSFFQINFLIIFIFP